MTMEELVYLEDTLCPMGSERREKLSGSWCLLRRKQTTGYRRR